jgi:hypothetical protein
LKVACRRIRWSEKRRFLGSNPYHRVCLIFTGPRESAVSRKVTIDTALDLGQLFPPFFTARCEDFSSSRRLLSGKIAVLVTTFSFGRLVCSFHEAGIIVKFIQNIQLFVFCDFLLSPKKSPPRRPFFMKNILVSSWTKIFFVVEFFSSSPSFVSF